MFDNNRLRQRRLDVGLTLEEVGNIAGISRSAVQKYEKGVIKNIYISTIELFSKALKCSPNYLMCWTDDPSVTPKKIELTNDELIQINKYRSLNDKGKIKLVSYTDDLINSGRYNPEQDEYLRQRDEYIKKHASPFAASDGDTSNLDEIQRLYDESVNKNTSNDHKNNSNND